MPKTNQLGLIITSLSLILTSHLPAQEVPTSGLYRIVSGRLISIGGFAGAESLTLPDESQGFISLTVDPLGTAEMKFLGADGKTVFRLPALGTRREIPFAFSSGVVTPNHIQFGSPLRPPFSGFGYGVSNAAGVLRINGILVERGVCCDVAYEFRHTNIVAILMPQTSIRVSETEICWNAISNQAYQVQYQTGLAAEPWNNLGDPVQGAGRELCVNDRIALGQAQRFYRVVPVLSFEHPTEIKIKKVGLRLRN